MMLKKFLIESFKLAYMAGKGRKSVPILIPVDVIEGIKLLISNREAFGIDASNHVLFATKSSTAHCSGFHTVAAVCEAAKYGADSITNTKESTSDKET
ncbi:hypothetical protein KUTeg_000008 [Tegillarca granosa]|uniref:Uncharacterized protein n=1 Tax=Tegillarca granosa TaxID=220873 RepID=A0ABQ9FYX0_TEGGR|nr:hypothetical protein KUTeg_000008 [Tegillarca granosa]